MCEGQSQAVYEAFSGRAARWPADGARPRRQAGGPSSQARTLSEHRDPWEEFTKVTGHTQKVWGGGFLELGLLALPNDRGFSKAQSEISHDNFRKEDDSVAVASGRRQACRGHLRRLVGEGNALAAPVWTPGLALTGLGFLFSIWNHLSLTVPWSREAGLDGGQGAVQHALPEARPVPSALSPHVKKPLSHLFVNSLAHSRRGHIIVVL